MAVEETVEAPEDHEEEEHEARGRGGKELARPFEQSSPAREKKSVFATFERRIKKLKAWEIVGLSVVGTLALDHALSARGHSALARMFGAGPPPCPRLPSSRTGFEGYVGYGDGSFYE